MKKINKSRFAILGMLFEKPQSGYSLLQMMRESTANFWQESDASIYPMLKILEKEGKVTSRTESTGRRERNLFEITEAGKKEFLEWMALLPEPQTYRNEFLLKLFFGGFVASQKIIKQLEGRRQMAEEERAHYKGIELNTVAPLSEKDPYKVFGMMTLRYGVCQVEAEIEWIDACIKMLDKK